MRFFVSFLCGLLWFSTFSFLMAEPTDFDEDLRAWQTLGFNFYEDDDWRFTGGLQTRLFDEASYLGAWLIFPTVQYKVHPNLDLGGTYLYEEIRAEAGEGFYKLHIFWLHASPHWKLNEDWTFAMRHVLGYRSIESYHDYWISRHRFSINCAVDAFGPLMNVGMGTELFYNYETDRLCENRLIPLNFCFKLGKQAKLSLYVMAQSKRFGNKDSWDTAYVFGQSVGYRF